ncbi:MAG: Ig-like domain-containing protein, partial [Limisphaerales bacterium]
DLKVEVDSVRETLPDSPSEPTLATESRGVETRPDIDASRVPPATPDPNASASVRHLRIAAAGLTVAALANLLVGSLVLAGAMGLVLVDRRGIDLDGALPPLVQWFQDPDPSGVKTAVFLVVAVALAASLITLLGARSMRRLASYRFAMTATTLGMVVPPGNLLGLPWGLWTLSVLGRRNSQAAFHANWKAAGSPRARPAFTAIRLASVVIIPVLLLAAIRGWMESQPGADRGRQAVLLANRLAQQADEALKAAARARAQGALPVPGATMTPPVAIETFPAAGDSDVDPDLAEIRVTFSRRMRDGQWSWADWMPGAFPEMTGTPRFLADGRTCVLPVRLEPGRVYGIWLNTGRHQNFRDSDGLPAVPYLLTFRTRDK